METSRGIVRLRLVWLTPVGDGRVLSLCGSIESYRHPGKSKMHFRNVRIEASGGEVTCILGLSGTGKTTLLRILLGTAPGELRGSVAYVAEDQVHTAQQIRRLGQVGVLSSDSCLLPWRTAQSNLALPAELNPNLRPHKLDEIVAALSRIHVSESNQRSCPEDLSFGLERRVALARALLHAPRFILLDEAFTGLDPVTAKTIATTLRTHVSVSASVCVLVTHDIDRALSLEGKLYYLSRNGELTELGRNQTAADISLRFQLDLDSAT